MRLRQAADVRETRFWRSRGLIDITLDSLTWIVAWPAVLTTLHGRTATYTNMQDAIVRRQLYVNGSVWLFSFATSVALLVGVSGHHWYLRTACYAVIIAVLSNSVGIVVNRFNVRAYLRSVLGNPIITFALYALANFLALTIAAFVLLRWPVHSPFRWKPLWREGLQILGSGQLSSIWRTRHAGLTVLLVAIASIAVYIRLLSQLWNPRRPDDHVNLARTLVLAGDLEDAESHLKLARPTILARSPDLVEVEGTLALAAHHFDRALKWARVMAMLYRSPTMPEDEDDARYLLADWALPIYDGRLYTPVVRYLVAHGISDSCLVRLIPATLTQWARDAPGAAPVKITGSRYPLTQARIEIENEQWLKAIERLEAVLPITAAEHILKRLLSRRASVGAAWSVSESNGVEAETQDTLSLVDDARSWLRQKLPWWLRMSLYHDMGERASAVRKRGDWKSATALLELRQSLVGN